MPLSFITRPSLVAYVTCGDPDLATTRDVILAAIEAGADVIELGVPFSDPVADGPVIQRASERALAKGTTLAQVLTLAAEIRQHSQSVGLILFSYLNPILRMGLEKFGKVARAAGLDGVLVTDLPVEEAGRIPTAHATERSGDSVSCRTDQSRRSFEADCACFQRLRLCRFAYRRDRCAPAVAGGRTKPRQAATQTYETSHCSWVWHLERASSSLR